MLIYDPGRLARIAAEEAPASLPARDPFAASHYAHLDLAFYGRNDVFTAETGSDGNISRRGRDDDLHVPKFHEIRNYIDNCKKNDQ